MSALKVILLVLTLNLILFILPTHSLAAGEPLGLSGDKLKEIWGANEQSGFSLNSLFFGSICQLTGIASIPGKLCPAYVYNSEAQKTELRAFAVTPGGGAFGSVTAVMTAMYTNPPTSTTDYLANLGGDLGIIKPAHAQVPGSGASIIEPVRLLWTITRNVAYLAFIIIFVAVGFMIMLRSKISAQAIISIQTALPGLVVGLILVTFSYFISALIIDASFLGVQVAAQIFMQVKDPNNPNQVFNVFGANIPNWAANSNLFQLFTGSVRFVDNANEITLGTQHLLDSIAGSTFPVTNIILAVIGGIIGFLTFAGGGWIAAIAGLAGGLLLPFIIGLLVPLILIIALFIQFVRLLFKLIGAYVSLLVSTITAPFIILYSSIPGKGGSLASWWKTMLANSLIFPAVFAAFLFAGMILYTQPASWSTTPPLFGGLSTELLRLIIAYAIILGTPAIPDMVKKAMGVQENQAISQEALAGVNAGLQGQGVLRGYAGSAINLSYQRGRWDPILAGLRNFRLLDPNLRRRVARPVGGPTPPTTP